MIKELRKITSPYLLKDLFNIAQDVENYPHYLPHCIGARILDKSGPRWRVQNLYRWGPASYKFTTLADIKPHNYIHIISDPAEKIQLDVRWEFSLAEDGQTAIQFELGFASSIPLLEKLVSAMLGDMAQQTQIAFLKRADELLKADHHV